MVKKLQENLVKEATKTGKDIKAGVKHEKAESPLKASKANKDPKVEKPAGFMKDISKDNLAKAPSNAIISGGKDAIGKGLENPFTR